MPKLNEILATGRKKSNKYAKTEMKLLLGQQPVLLLISLTRKLVNGSSLSTSNVTESSHDNFAR